MSKYYIGVDLGKTGGIVIMEGKKLIYKCPMPVVGGEVDILVSARLLKKYKLDSHMVMEKFGGFMGYGKKAVSSLAEQAGIFRALSIVLSIPMTRVMPQVWQKEMWQGTTIQFKNVKGVKKKDTKKTSTMTATRLFPSVSFIPTERSKNPHDGLIDAALLAEYGRRKGF